MGICSVQKHKSTRTNSNLIRLIKIELDDQNYENQNDTLNAKILKLWAKTESIINELTFSEQTQDLFYTKVATQNILKNAAKKSLNQSHRNTLPLVRDPVLIQIIFRQLEKIKSIYCDNLQVDSQFCANNQRQSTKLNKIIVSILDIQQQLKSQFNRGTTGTQEL